MFDTKVTADILAHAEKAFPQESCGLVVDGVYLPRRNLSEDPEHGFHISPQAYMAASRRGTIEAVAHSHPNGPAHPSEDDMRSQIESAVPWAIAVVGETIATEVFWWGGGAPRAPLIGRSFRHGVTDCYALLRDYYALERGIELPEFPRRSQWWDLGGDMLAENFEQVGFRQLHGPDQLAPGDALLGRIGGGVVNHCGIYIGQGLILHHLTNRLSRREPLEPWKRYISHYLRYEP